MLDRLQLNNNFSYFRVVKKIPKNLIENCLGLASAKAEGHVTKLIRQSLTTAKGSASLVSIAFFRIESRPTFLISGDEKNVTYCYAVIIEHGEQIAIARSGAQDFSKLLKRHVKVIPHERLAQAFLDEASTFEKITAQNIGVSKHTPQRSTYEDRHLQESMPMLGASNKLVSNYKHKTKGQSYSVNQKRSKVNVLGSKKRNINESCFSIDNAFLGFNSKKINNSFLDNFAKVLLLADYASKITPTGILFNFMDLYDYIEQHENQAPVLYYQKRNNRKIYFKKPISEYMDDIELLCDITTERIDKKISILKIDNPLDSTMVLAHNDEEYFIKSEKFSRLFLEFGENTSIRLQDFINEKHCFTLTFDQPDIHYTGGQLCSDSKLLGDINSFLQLFIADDSLEGVNSEKGKGKRKASDKDFVKDSIFKFVENRYSAEMDYLILDDLGDENADYIAIKTKQKVRLIHCKAGKEKFSATAFQDVVGQAMKNLNFFVKKVEFEKKLQGWRKKYAKTKISRIRKGESKTIVKDLLSTFSGNFDREVYLVVNFLSVKTITEELRKMADGEQAKRATAHLLWLLSSLKNSCQERGAKIYIICKP